MDDTQSRFTSTRGTVACYKPIHSSSTFPVTSADNEQGTHQLSGRGCSDRRVKEADNVALIYVTYFRFAIG